MAKRKPKIKNNRDIAMVNYGPEPSWDDAGDAKFDAELRLVQALNWYNYCCTIVEEKKWTTEWAKDNLSPEDAKLVSKADKKAFANIGRFARVKTLGCPVPLSPSVEDMLEPLLTKARRNKSTASQETPKKNIQDYIRENYAEISANLQVEIDAACEAARKGNKYNFDFGDWVKQNNIANLYLKKIAEEITPILEEYKLAAAKKDPQLVEGYSIYKAKGLKLMIAFMEDILKGCETVKTSTPRRVYRKRKPKDKTKVVAKVRYLTEHKPLKIRSKNPVNILNAKMVVVYNTKYDTIEVYEGMVSGLSVKGARIVNFDPSKTYKQKVRKPKDLIKSINGKGIRAFKNAMKEIKTKKNIPSGLVGEHSVILLVF